MKKRKRNFKNAKNSLNKLSLFQKSDAKFSRKCPFSIKNAPIIDYKNISLLSKYITETNKIITSKISNVSLGKQKKLAREIKKAQILGIL
jgi:small subunit ribosomal protein S18|tara:strand:- start:357 stop:626 length:270 start_codon:yes stop_codon:yes gene_type:complete